MKIRLGLTPKLALTFAAFAAVLLAAMGALGYRDARTALFDATMVELSATAIEKQSAIEAWIAGSRADIAALAASPTASDHLAALITAPQGSSASRAAHARLVGELRTHAGPGRAFLVVFAMEPDEGKVIAATDALEEGKFRADLPYFTLGKKGPCVQNPYYSFHVRGLAMTAAAPVRSQTGRLLGVLAGHLDLEEMNAVILRRSGLRHSDDAYLVNSSNLFVTQPRLIADPAVLRLGVHTEHVRRCLAGGSGSMLATDYRGVPVVTAYRWLPDRQMCLVVKVDQAEAFARPAALGRALLLLGALTLMVASALGLGLARVLTGPLRSLRAGAIRIGGGERHEHLPEMRGDELGDLAREFNAMDAALQARAAEARRAEEALRESEARLRLQIERMPVGCIVWSPDFRVVSWNPAAERIFGFAQEEALGKRPYGLIVPAEAQPHVDVVWRALLEGDTGADSVNENLTRDDRRILCSWSNVPLRSSDGAVLGVLSMVEDITERKAAEEARLARESAERANQAKSEFLSRMSHELRTPLNAILGFAQLLEMDTLSPGQREATAHILRAGRHLLDLINEVLDIARIEAGRLSLSPEPVPLARLVGECVGLMEPAAFEAGIVLHDDTAQVGDQHVLADLQRLKQVLLNLLSNAIKFTPRGGRAVIACGQGEPGRLRITVADTGPGIPAERLPHLFTPFERLGAEAAGIEGTGLGLALSKRLIEAMAGAIGVESTPGRGSEFWVELPSAAGPAEEVGGVRERQPRSQAAGAQSAGARAGAERPAVLYIEDNLSNVRLVERIMNRRPGVRLITAMQGRLGLDLAREHRPRLIMLDLHLPDIEGDEVLARLLEDPRTRGIPVVILSATAHSSHIKRLLAAGARRYLTKPLDVAQFLEVIDELMGSNLTGNGRPET